VKLNEIAGRIHAHLQRFEADPKINVWANGKVGGTRPYYCAGAWARGRYVYVKYKSYQGNNNISKADAERYLEKLDAGFVGRHFEALRESMGANHG
jgi:hypothetical protein